MRVRLRSGWTAAVLLTLATLAIWLPDINLPLGNSDDGRLVAFSGLHARTFWELGPLESRLGARVDPFVRPEFGVEPRSVAPVDATTYAHHPPLKEFLSIGSSGLLGENLPALRVPIFLLGAATLLFMASLLRACGIRWGPTLLAMGAMASTGFFYVYGRLGVSFSLLVASAAAVAWMRNSERLSRWALVGLGALAALTAMQSWISIAALGPLALWLFVCRFRQQRATGAMSAPRRSLRYWLVAGWSPALTAFVIGAIVGLGITFSWMLYATGFTELSEQVSLRASNSVSSNGQTSTFGFGEFLARQWRFATEELLVPPWLRFLLIPALFAGLFDRRTRVATAITLGVAAALTFGIQQGAWIHRLWNFPWLVPVTIGLAVIIEHARNSLGRWLRIAAALGATGVIVGTMAVVVTGSTRDRYITEPAQVGEALEQVAAKSEAAQADLIWAGPGLPAPRWASYYLDVPVFEISADRFDDLEMNDIVVVRASRVPDYFPRGALDESLAAVGDFRVLTADRLIDDTSAVTGISYVVVPHPDDEMQAWSLIEDTPDTFKVFLVMTKGEQTLNCATPGYDEGTGEMPPSPWPTGKWATSCEVARQDSFFQFMTGMAASDEGLPAPFRHKGSKGPFPSLGYTICRHDKGDCESDRTADVWTSARGVVVWFNLGDSDLTEDEVVWAIKTVRDNPIDFGINDSRLNRYLLGASYWNGSHADCYIYDDADHFAVHQALWNTDFDIGLQMAPTCASDPAVQRTEEVSLAHFNDAFGVSGSERIGEHVVHYGWLYGYSPGYWEGDYTGQNEVFHRHQTFWARYG